jgi:hypothetical protein
MYMKVIVRNLLLILIITAGSGAGLHAQMYTGIGIYVTLDDFNNGRFVKVQKLTENKKKGIMEVEINGAKSVYKTDSILGFLSEGGSLVRSYRGTESTWGEVSLRYAGDVCYWYCDFSDGGGMGFISKGIDGKLYPFNHKGDIDKLAVHKEFKAILDCCRAGKAPSFAYSNLIFKCFGDDPKSKDGKELVLENIKKRTAAPQGH